MKKRKMKLTLKNIKKNKKTKKFVFFLYIYIPIYINIYNDIKRRARANLLKSDMHNVYTYVCICIIWRA